MNDVTVVDYGAGNLFSVVRAVENVGGQPKITSDPQDVLSATALIVPGVGAAEDTMRNLRSKRLTEPLLEYISSGRPFLGVCMGMQALFEKSYEGGEHDCLGVLEGTIERFPTDTVVPHMGWNTIHDVADHAILEGFDDGAYLYFVHSYYAQPSVDGVVLARAEYGGVNFPAIVGRDNLIATQFHPEKSGETGLLIYKNFVENSTSKG